MRKDGFDISDLEEIIIEKKETKEINPPNKIEDKTILEKKEKILNINSLSNNTKINKDIDNNIKKNNIYNIKKDLINKNILEREETRGRKKSKNKKFKTFTSKLYEKQKETIDNIKQELDIETDYELLLFLLKKSTIRNNIDIDLFLIK